MQSDLILSKSTWEQAQATQSTIHKTVHMDKKTATDGQIKEQKEWIHLTGRARPQIPPTGQLTEASGRPHTVHYWSKSSKYLERHTLLWKAANRVT